MQGSGTSGSSQGKYSSMQGKYSSMQGSDTSKMKIKVLCFSECKPVFSSKDGSLHYTGGNSHLVHFKNDVSYVEFRKKITSVFKIDIRGIRYYLPGHGLVNLSTDEDVRNMIEEFDDFNIMKGPQIIKVFLDELEVSYSDY